MTFKSKLTGDWDKLKNINSANLKEFNKDIADRLEKFLNKKEKEIKKNIASGGVPSRRLTGLTIELRGGSSNPLRDSGKLFSSIRTKIRKSGANFGGTVGLYKGDTASDGRDLIVVAQALDRGATIAISISARSLLNTWLMKFFGVSLREDTKAIIIPPRPFISPALEGSSKDIKKSSKISLRKLRARFNK